jgi:hypothetical protein
MGTCKMANSSAPELWRVRLRSLQVDFQEAARRHPALFAEVVIGPMPATCAEVDFTTAWQQRVRKGCFVALHAFPRPQDESFFCSIILNKDTKPSERDEGAVRCFGELRSVASAYFSEAPDELLAKALPSRNRPPLPNIAPLPRGPIPDDWLELLFYLAWHHPSAVLRAVPQVWLQRQFASSKSVFVPLAEAHSLESRGFVRPFPHSLFSRLPHDVWRSSDAAIDVLLQLAPSLPDHAPAAPCGDAPTSGAARVDAGIAIGSTTSNPTPMTASPIAGHHGAGNVVDVVPIQPGPVGDLARYHRALRGVFHAWHLLAAYVWVRLSTTLRKTHNIALSDRFTSDPELPRSFSEACTGFQAALRTFDKLDAVPADFPWLTFGGQNLTLAGPCPDLEKWLESVEAVGADLWQRDVIEPFQVCVGESRKRFEAFSEQFERTKKKVIGRFG